MFKSSTHASESPFEEESLRNTGSGFGFRLLFVIFVAATCYLGYKAYRYNLALEDGRLQLAQAGSDVAQARADLQNAGASSAKYQAELSKADAREAETNALLTKAQGQLKDLQAQLDRSQAERADLQSQLASANSQAADLRVQLGQSSDESSALRKELDSSKVRTADLQAQPANPQGAPAVQPPPPVILRALPVETAFKKSFWGRHFTLHIKNQYPEELAVSIAVGAPGKSPPMSATIKSGSSFDVKNLAAGTTVVITSGDFEALSLTAR